MSDPKTLARRIESRLPFFGWWYANDRDLGEFNKLCRSRLGVDAIAIQSTDSTRDGTTFTAFVAVWNDPNGGTGQIVLGTYQRSAAAEIQRLVASGQHVTGFAVGDAGYLLIEPSYRKPYAERLRVVLAEWVDALSSGLISEDWQENTTKGWAEYFGKSKDGRTITEWATKFNWIKLATGYTRGRYAVDVNDPEVIARRKAATKNNRK
jgi:hypothetical protein